MNEVESKEAYVSLLTARYLKDSGFDWPVRSFYQEPKPGTHLDRLFKSNPQEHAAHYRHDIGYSLKDWNSEVMVDRVYYSCPTLAVAQRWLREVKHVSVEGGFARRPKDYVTVVIPEYNHVERLFGEDFELGVQAWRFSSYEEAVEYGIEFVIKMLLKGGEL